MKKWFLISFTSSEPLGGKFGSKTFVKFCSEEKVFNFDKTPTLQIAYNDLKCETSEIPTPQRTLAYAREYFWSVEELTPSGKKIGRADLVNAAFTEELVDQFYNAFDSLVPIT